MNYVLYKPMQFRCRVSDVLSSRFCSYAGAREYPNSSADDRRFDVLYLQLWLCIFELPNLSILHVPRLRLHTRTLFTGQLFMPSYYVHPFNEKLLWMSFAFVNIGVNRWLSVNLYELFLWKSLCARSDRELLYKHSNSAITYAEHTIFHEDHWVRNYLRLCQWIQCWFQRSASLHLHCTNYFCRHLDFKRGLLCL